MQRFFLNNKSLIKIFSIPKLKAVECIKLGEFIIRITTLLRCVSFAEMMHQTHEFRIG
jgi:hypothetical protein